jgi:hypothetical protein
MTRTKRLRAAIVAAIVLLGVLSAQAWASYNHVSTCEATLRGYYSDDDVHSWGVTTGASSFGGWGASGHYSDGSVYVWGGFVFSYGKVVAYKGRCSGGDFASDWFVGF